MKVRKFVFSTLIRDCALVLHGEEGAAQFSFQLRECNDVEIHIPWVAGHEIVSHDLGSVSQEVRRARVAMNTWFCRATMHKVATVQLDELPFKVHKADKICGKWDSSARSVSKLDPSSVSDTRLGRAGSAG